MTKNEINGKIIKELLDKYKDTGRRFYIGKNDMILKAITDSIIESVVKDIKIEITDTGVSSAFFIVKAKLHGDKEVDVSGYLNNVGGN